MDFSRALFDAGVMATGIAFPTVPEGKARIRTIMTSEHTRAQIDQALEIITTTAQEIRRARLTRQSAAVSNNSWL